MENLDLENILARLDKIEKKLLELENIKPETLIRSKILVPGLKGISLKEFLISKKPKSEVQKALVLAYFLEKNDGAQSFNADDLEKTFERSKEKKPSNINDVVNRNIKNGHMDEVAVKKDNKKAWHLTNSGEHFVENDLKDDKKS